MKLQKHQNGGLHVKRNRGTKAERQIGWDRRSGRRGIDRISQAVLHMADHQHAQVHIGGGQHLASLPRMY